MYRRRAPGDQLEERVDDKLYNHWFHAGNLRNSHAPSTSMQPLGHIQDPSMHSAPVLLH